MLPKRRVQSEARLIALWSQIEFNFVWFLMFAKRLSFINAMWCNVKYFVKDSKSLFSI